MLGMNASSGRRLDGDAHLRQSIADILLTPVGSRVMRRDYGSALLDLVDQPANRATRLRLYAAVAVALMRWEPRIRIRKISLQPGSDAGEWFLELDVLRADQPGRPAPQSLGVPLRFRASPLTASPALA